MQLERVTGKEGLGRWPLWFKGASSRKKYDVLVDDAGRCVMSNSPYELETCEWMAQAAKGDVLVLGLGIGFINCLMRSNQAVNTIAVIEKDPRVIELSKPKVGKDEVFQADAQSIDDIKRVIGSRKFDTVIWDLFGADGFMPVYDSILNPGGKVLVWSHIDGDELESLV